MKFVTFVFVMLAPLLSLIIQKMYLIEVDPIDFVCEHQKQIKGDPDGLFEFLTTSLGMEKLLPWLSRFKEADTRLVGLGKSYRATLNTPILGEERVYATLTEYKPRKRLALEFDDLMRRSVVIRLRSYHDRTLLQASVYFRRTSFLYQYTVGYIMRMVMKSQLEKSMKNFAILHANLDGPNQIPNFSKSRVQRV
ncbi:uncharacterized protein LOC106640408 [Copidosoma floridanum]|uniref:uncharacterized protein LOC106640408 n=1 Tax=Copidosoma floridanum TaxID=29053 RepID=UPI0006C97061|nr:uncharacterized protein LOC106640408 [Copidosoma floridanum]